jgi:hypothetical protein
VGLHHDEVDQVENATRADEAITDCQRKRGYGGKPWFPSVRYPGPMPGAKNKSGQWPLLCFPGPVLPPAAGVLRK